MRFVAQTNCFFGSSKYDDLHASLGGIFADCGLVIVDESVADSLWFEEIIDTITKGAPNESIRVHVPFEPTYDQLDHLAADVRRLSPDYLIAVGGGSVLDLAKGTAILLTNKGNSRDYRGFGRVLNPPRPLLAVPTTAGSGSEVTWTASLIDDESRVKFGINGPNVFPSAALLEPRLLIDCPRSVAISAALDALVHAVEAISSPMASEPASALATRSVALVANNIETALKSQGEEPWQLVQMGAYLAGLAMLNSSGGIASGLSYTIGTAFNVPHGFAGGILLPRILELNSARGFTGYESLQWKPGESLEKMVKELYARLAVPIDFRQWNIEGHEAVNQLFDLTMQQRSESLAYNPTPFNDSDLRELLSHLCLTT